GDFGDHTGYFWLCWGGGGWRRYRRHIPASRGLEFGRFVPAALPPAVRKGSAFPEGSLNHLYPRLHVGFARVTLNVSMAPMSHKENRSNLSVMHQFHRSRIYNIITTCRY